LIYLPFGKLKEFCILIRVLKPRRAFSGTGIKISQARRVSRKLGYLWSKELKSNFESVLKLENCLTFYTFFKILISLISSVVFPEVLGARNI
jgi:hypothetical protein